MCVCGSCGKELKEVWSVRCLRDEKIHSAKCCSEVCSINFCEDTFFYNYKRIK